MTPQYRYYTIKSRVTCFAEALSEMLKSLDKGRVVRFTLFTSCSSNSEYMEQYVCMQSALKGLFEEKMPAWSLVAQQPLDTAFCCEVAELVGDCFAVKYHDYGVEVYGNGYREIVVGGVSGDCVNESIEEQCNAVFEKIANILEAQGASADRIVRQWNYIEAITNLEGTRQHYQLFNDARSRLYDTVSWGSGYPAATGIGASFGGVVIDLNVIITSTAKMYRLDNPLQIAAHQYSQNVLIGEASCGFVNTSTPKFERAKLVESGDNILLYISGTAAIRGEESLLGQDATMQTMVTMENINHLISVSNQDIYGVGEPREVSFQTLRVYIKNTEDYNVVERYMESEYSKYDKLFLHCDVCREELLVEIEGIATTSYV